MSRTRRQIIIGHKLIVWFINHYILLRTQKPISSVISVTNRCNQLCQYCNYPRNNTKELDLESIKNIISSLKQNGVARIGITGGEPFCRDDLLEILKHSYSKNIYTTLNTNLTNLKNEDEVFNYVDCIFTSIDSMDEIHKKLRGKDINITKRAITKLIEQKRKVIVIFVLTELNLKKWYSVFEYCKELNIKLHIQIQCSGALITRGELDNKLSNQIRYELNSMLKIKKANPLVFLNTISYFEKLISWKNYAQTTQYVKKSKCYAGKIFNYIDCTGSISPCAYLSGRVSYDFFSPIHKTQKTSCNDCIVGPYLQLNTILFNDGLVKEFLTIVLFLLKTSLKKVIVYLKNARTPVKSNL